MTIAIALAGVLATAPRPAAGHGKLGGPTTIGPADATPV
jgi:hypothetical protein